MIRFETTVPVAGRQVKASVSAEVALCGLKARIATIQVAGMPAAIRGGAVMSRLPLATYARLCEEALAQASLRPVEPLALAAVEACDGWEIVR